MEIESLNHSGFATTMLGMAKYSLGYAKAPGYMQCWYRDASIAGEEYNVGYAARPISSRNPILRVLSVLHYLSNIYLACMD